jgi:hypothetical protein
MTSHNSAAQVLNPGLSRVTITSPLPLPVTGTLSFATGSAVTVNNPASNPVLVRDVDRGTPLQKYAATTKGSILFFGQVPAGQRWIVEHVSAKVHGPAPLDIPGISLVGGGEEGGLPHSTENSARHIHD